MNVTPMLIVCRSWRSEKSRRCSVGSRTARSLLRDSAVDFRTPSDRVRGSATRPVRVQEGEQETQRLAAEAHGSGSSSM